MVVDYLLEHHHCTQREEAFLAVQKRLLASTDGPSVGIAASDGIFTPLTCMGGTVRMEAGRLRQSVDVRFPTTQTAEHIEKTLRELAEGVGGGYERGYVRQPFLIDPDSPPVRACTEAYRDVTGREDPLLTTGGGTYAHNFRRAISFGMESPAHDYPGWVGPMHGADEGVPEEWLFQSLKVYLLAVARLLELDLG